MRYLFGIGLGAVLFLALLEVGLRFLPVNSGLRMEATTEAMPFGRYLPGQNYVYSHGWAIANTKRSITNAQGFTNSADFGTATKVLVVGDSFVESLMLDYKETMQGRLDSAMGGGVYAAASSGNGLADSLKIVSYFAPNIRSSTVVLFVEPTDLSGLLLAPSRGHSAFNASGAQVQVIHNEYRESPTKEMVLKSALARYMYYNLKFPDWVGQAVKFGGRSEKETPGDNLEKKALVLDFYLENLRILASAGAFKIVFLLDGDRKAIYAGKSGQVGSWNASDRELFLQQTRKHGLEVIDMQPVFEKHWSKYRERMDFLPMDGHWNPIAHKLASDALLKRVFAGADQSGRP